MSPDSNPPTPAVSRRGLYLAGISALIVAVVVVVFGITTRKVADAKLQEWTEAQAIPVVAVAPPDTRGKTATFSLPGRLEAYIQAQIYARVTGSVEEMGRRNMARRSRPASCLPRSTRLISTSGSFRSRGQSGERQSQFRPVGRDPQARPKPDHELRHFAAGPRPAGGGRFQQAGLGARGPGQPRSPARARTI